MSKESLVVPKPIHFHEQYVVMFKKEVVNENNIEKATLTITLGSIENVQSNHNLNPILVHLIKSENNLTRK